MYDASIKVFMPMDFEKYLMHVYNIALNKQKDKYKTESAEKELCSLLLTFIIKNKKEVRGIG